MSSPDKDNHERDVLDFLSWIDSDELVAAKRYLLLHKKLVTFFRNNHVESEAERLADKTLDGVAGYVTEGKSIDREKLEGFVLQRASTTGS